WVTLEDWRPTLLPPPARRASASNDAVTNAAPEMAMSAAATNREKQNLVMDLLPRTRASRCPEQRKAARIVRPFSATFLQ
ncbi:hypothetical protein, partial [Achromobacter sp. 2789STDY5608633]|uniref:hypothetical protein n=1 Tax=Achromobacter sp. 2789STDY5608633 TaxID=1806501 RepID=UPI0026F45294